MLVLSFCAAVYLFRELLQQRSALFGIQFLLQLLQSKGDDVIVVSARILGVAGNFQPDIVQEFQVARPQARRMRPQCVFAYRTIGRVNLEGEAGTTPMSRLADWLQPVLEAVQERAEVSTG